MPRFVRPLAALHTCAVALALVAAAAFADGPSDNVAVNVRRVPKKGIELPPEDRKALDAGLEELNKAVSALERRRDARTPRFLPDVLIFRNAVRDALKYDEIFDKPDIPRARAILKEGQSRANALLEGKTPWATQKGLTVRGYVSKIDGSVQPYGLVIPESYAFDGPTKFRLDVWFHGRGEVLSEVNFLADRLRNPGTFTPADTIVLHPYGRYCNANKFAGEVDTLEALESVKSHYKVDDDRVSVRGFSMGGAACWQFAVHYADRWFAANPGAGFSETKRFLNVFQKEAVSPPAWEQKLWAWYDCDLWAANLIHCPTVAYSGELDSQKQAADVMAEALKGLNIELAHVIGPKTKHAYHPVSRQVVDDKMADLARTGRDRVPLELAFVTYTLKYNRMHWLTVDALAQHWEKAAVQGTVISGSEVSLRLMNVNAVTLDFPAGSSPFALGRVVTVRLNDQPIIVPGPRSDRSFSASFRKEKDKWVLGPLPSDSLIKRHDLQGPVDDAFMDSFLIVKPTGKSKHPKVQTWVESELARAIEHWRRHFRGEARVKDDTAVADADIAAHNLILWGDPESNAVLKKIADKLPIAWKADAIQVGGKSYPSADRAPILIYPNPLNPKKYVVLNSGFTFRDYDYLNNARQVAKLPDWAVIDLNTPPNARYAGKVEDAGFFDENWKLK